MTVIATVFLGMMMQVPTTGKVPMLQPKELTPANREAALRLSIYEGAMASVFVSITSNGLVTGLALYLGASPFVLGVIGALPFVTQLFQLLGAYLEERFGNRRVLAVISEGVSRILWAPIAVLPFLPYSPTVLITLFVVLQFISAAANGINVNSWSSWMTDLVPAERRGRYFGIRNTVASVATMIAGLASGYTLDYYKTNVSEAYAYAVALAIGVVTAMIGVVMVCFQAEPPLQRRGDLNIRTMFVAPLKDLPYRRLILASATWAFVVGVASPFFTAYGIDTLHMTFAELAYMGIVSSVASIVIYPIVGRLQDRFGDKIVLVWSAFCVVPLPLGWIFSQPGWLWPLFCTSLFAGVFWPGINQGLANLSMARAPQTGKGAYIAAYGAVSGIGVVLSGLCGGLIAQLIDTTTWQIAGVTINHYAALFVISMVLRFVAAMWVMRRL